MKVIVDRSRCQGHARCIASAPEVFDIDEEGKSFARSDELLPQHAEQANRSVAACPEQAICIVRDA